MMELIFAVIAFLVLISFLVWRPFLKQSAKDSTNKSTSLRDDTNVRLYHEHKSEIEKDYAEGGIDEESYQYLLNELDNSLLQDIEANKAERKVINDNKATGHFSMIWPIAIILFVVVFSASLYTRNGAYQTFSSPKIVASKGNQQQGQQAPVVDERQQMLTHIKELQAILKENPNDGDAWYNLGQSLLGEGAFDAAIESFNQVIRIEGDKAELFGAKAQANYYKNEQKIDEVVQKLIDQALALDAADPSTNILLGMHNFIGQNYQQAIDYWQVVIKSNRPSVNIQALNEAVTEAKSRLAMASGQPPISTKRQGNNQADGIGPQITVNVSLTDEVVQQLSQGEDRVVFIYAIPTDGRRMPLAAVKTMASSLPTTVVLTDKQAMSPRANLSSAESVHVFAIVSKLGGAGIKPGDFKAEANDIPVTQTEAINLIVNKLVE